MQAERAAQSLSIEAPPRPLDARTLIALWATAFAASAAIGTHGLAYWDAGDYVRLAAGGGVSGLLLGRPIFLAIGRAVVAVVLRAGGSATAIEPALRWWWCAVGATASPLLALVVERLHLRAPPELRAKPPEQRAHSIAAGLALALSPSFAHTAHQVLTDAPALAATLLAIAIALPPPTIVVSGAIDPARAIVVPRAIRAARAASAGAMLAVAIATRESAVVFALSVAILAHRGGRGPLLNALAALLATLVVVVVASHGGTLESLRAWASAMGRSSGAHPLSPRDVLISIGWLFALGPLPVIAGMLAFVRALRTREAPFGDRRDVLAIALPAAIGTLLLLFYPDGSFSPRYLLATAPLALILLGAPTIARLLTSRWRALAAAALLAPLLVSKLCTRSADAIAARAAQVGARLEGLPEDALIVPGHVCPAVGAALAADDAVRARDGGGDPRRRDRVSLLCPGWGWPADAGVLAGTLDRARCGGRLVALDLGDDAWIGERELPDRDQLRAYAGAESHADVDAHGWTRLAPLPREDPRCEAVTTPR